MGNRTRYRCRGEEQQEEGRVEWRGVVTLAVMAIVAFGLARSGADLMLRANDLGHPTDEDVALRPATNR